MDNKKVEVTESGVLRKGLDETLYQTHKSALENAPKKVDNSPPKLAVACYFNVSRLASERRRLAILEKENRQILRKINEIYRTKGKVDNSTPNFARSTNYHERFIQNKQIEKENLKLYNELQSVKATIPSKSVLDKEYEITFEKIMFQSRYLDYYLSLIPEWETWDICPSNLAKKKCCNVNQRVHCFMDIAIDDPRTSNKQIKLGRLIFEIYRDFAPITADNFLTFLKGYSEKSYKGTQFFRIQKGIGCVGGDVECDDGGGYFTIGGKCFPDENHLLEFNGPGVISTFTLFPGHNHSHFFISFRKLEAMNGKCVAFGRVIKSLLALERLEEFGTLSGTPRQKVVITKCGTIDRNKGEAKKQNSPIK